MENKKPATSKLSDMPTLLSPSPPRGEGGCIPCIEMMHHNNLNGTSCKDRVVGLSRWWLAC